MNAKCYVLSVVVCLLAAHDGPAAEKQKTPATELQRLAQRVKAVAQLEGKDYLAKRNELTAEARKNKELFAALRKTPKDPEVALVCAIVLERVEKQAEIKKFVNGQLVVGYARRYQTALKEHARVLARAGSAVPMLLVEKLWKGNEAKLWESAIDRHALVRALGMLEVKAARYPMEKLLDLKDNEKLTREGLKALEVIGDPRTVPAIIRMLERDPKLQEDTTRAAQWALATCASEEQVPMLLRLLRTTKNPRVGWAAAHAISVLKGLEFFDRQSYRWGRGYIDRDGRMVIKPKRWRTYRFVEGLAAFKTGQKWGFIDGNGKTVIQPKYAETRDFSEGLAAVRLGDKWGYINKKGEETIKPTFVRAENFRDGMAIVAVPPPPGGQSVKWGYINKKGAFAIKPEFDRVREFSEGRAAVMLGNRWGFIDRTGKVVVKPQFVSVGKFSDGRAYIRVIEQVFPVMPETRAAEEGD